MADINKDVKEISIPDWSRTARPIEDPKADLSMSTLFKGIGDTLSNVAQAGDTLVKDIVSEGIYKDVSKQRQEFSNELTQYKTDLQPKSGLDSMAQATEDMPGELNGLGDSMSGLQAAQAGGKISTSQYWLAIDNIAKDYRSRFPGHREYIDQTVSQITGHNPANAYMTSIMQDLNRMTGGKTDPIVTKAIGMVFDLAKDGAIPKDQVGQLLLAAQTNPLKVLEYSTNKNAPKRASEESGWAFTTRTNNLENDAITAKRAADRYTNSNMFSNVNGPLIFAGESIASIQKKAFDMMADPSKANPKDAEVLAFKAVAIRQMSENETRRWLNETKNADGITVAQAMAGKNADVSKVVNDFIKEKYQVFDQQVKNLVDKHPTLAAYQTQWMQAEATNDRFNALKTPFGTHLRIMALMDKYPEDVKEYMKGILNNQYGESANVNVFVKDMMGQFMTGHGNGAPIVSVDAAIKQARAAGVTDPKVYSDFATYGTNLLNPQLSDTAKVSLAASMFHPSNLKFLSNFNDDQIVTDANGQQRTIKGKYSLWAAYTTPAMVAEIKRLSENGHPEIGAWYKNWTEQGFGSDIFGSQIRQLSAIAADPRVKLTYNNVENQWNPPESTATGAALAMQERSGVLDRIRDSVTQLNYGLRGLANQAALRNITKPEDVQGYVLGQLKGLGFVEPTPTVRPDPKVLSDQIFNAFIGAAKQFNPAAGGNKRSKFERPQEGAMQYDESSRVASVPEWQRSLETRKTASAPELTGNSDPTPAFEQAKNILNLNKQEENLFNYHTANLTGKGKIVKGNDISTVKATTVELDGKHYVIPTVWKGKEVSSSQAVANAERVGIDNFPSYATEESAQRRYSAIHDYIERDTENYKKRKREMQQ